MTQPTTPQTAREFLASQTGKNGQPLAKSGPGVRGRFSNEAVEVLTAARASGIVFADDVKVVKAPAKAATSTPATPAAPKVETPKVDTSDVDPKEVRAWARNVGKTIGQRGRIHSSIIAEYLAANGTQVKQVKRPTPADMPKRRPQTVGYVLDPKIGKGNTLVALTRCAQTDKGGCGKPVTNCTHDVPLVPHYFPEGIALTPMLLDKPVV